MMTLKKNYFLLLMVLLLQGSRTLAQSAEYYAGHKRTGVDLLWFKNFKDKQQKASPFLFFSRSRASVDYHNSPGSFGVVNAVSYNFKSGIGIVAVASFINTGFTPKAGVQLYKQKGNFLFFGWLVSDLKKKGSIDLFGLFRYQPYLKKEIRLFSQLELFPVYNTGNENWNLTQRLRLGVRRRAWAGGFMLDLNQSGKNDFVSTQNTGGFLRYEF